MLREVRRFEKSLISDFFRLHNRKNDAGWCFCAAWWAESWDGWGDRAAHDNRQLRNELLARGEFDGYLLYVDDEPVGWCQVGLRDRLRKLARQFARKPDPETWAITCFLIRPDFRGKGLATFLLQRILADLKDRGIHRVEVYPKRGADLEAKDMWNGPEAMYIRAGFTVDVDDSQRPVFTYDLSN